MRCIRLKVDKHACNAICDLKKKKKEGTKRKNCKKKVVLSDSAVHDLWSALSRNLIGRHVGFLVWEGEEKSQKM